MQNNYEQLRKIYNNTFYSDGIPLEFGCEVIYKSKKYFYGGKTKVDGFDLPQLLLHRENENTLILPFYKADKEDGWIENIGKTLTHVDVLRLLKMTGDTRYESTILIGDKLRISRPTNKTETHIEEGVGINNEQYGVVTNDVWLDITIDLTKDLKYQPELLQAIINIVK